MHVITKQFDFCYGHRVWSQELNSKFSIDSCLKCRHLHGHQGTILVSLTANELNGGMITDFKHLNWFKKWLDDTLDHKFIMDINDPLVPHEVPHIFDGHREMKFEFLIPQTGNYWFISKTKLENILKYEPALKEKYEGMVFVEFVPTSENLAKWLCDIIQDKMKPLNVKVSSVQLFETPKSSSTYTP